MKSKNSAKIRLARPGDAAAITRLRGNLELPRGQHYVAVVDGRIRACAALVLLTNEPFSKFLSATLMFLSDDGTDDGRTALLELIEEAARTYPDVAVTTYWQPDLFAQLAERGFCAMSTSWQRPRLPVEAAS